MSAPTIMLDALLKQSIVQVHVTGRSLSIYPHRAGDTIVFHPTGQPTTEPARPYEVRWIVKGLAANQRLIIVPDRQSPNGLPFAQMRNAITVSGGPLLTAVSGRADAGPGQGRMMTCKYDVVLEEMQNGKWTSVAEVDPTIVVIEDP